jgi:hypothetical protein
MWMEIKRGKKNSAGKKKQADIEIQGESLKIQL